MMERLAFQSELVKTLSGRYINKSILLDKAFQSYSFGKKKGLSKFFWIFYLTNERSDE